MLLSLSAACRLQCLTCTLSSEHTSHKVRTMVKRQAQQHSVCLQVQQQQQLPSSPASCDDALLTGGRTGELVINAAGKGLSPAASSPGAQTAPNKRVDSSPRHSQAQVSPATLLCE